MELINPDRADQSVILLVICVSNIILIYNLL